MGVDVLTDIRKMNSVGKDSKLALSLADVVDELDLPARLKKELRHLAKVRAETGFFIVQNPTATHEGRGTYIFCNPCEYNPFDMHIYSKGLGSGAPSIQNKGAEFGAFGPFNGSFFYDKCADWPAEHLTPPRINGTLYTFQAAIEFLHALEVMVNAVHQNDITSLEEGIAKGLTIPLNIITYDGLTRHIIEKAEKEEPEVIKKYRDLMQLCNLTLIVPSQQRVDIPLRESFIAQGRIKNEKLVNVFAEYNQAVTPDIWGVSDDLSAFFALGKAVRAIANNGVFIYERGSAHQQQLYLAPNSATPFGDLGDGVLLRHLPADKRKEFILDQLVYSFHLPIMTVKDGIKCREAIFEGFFGDREKAVKYANKFALGCEMNSQLAEEIKTYMPDNTIPVDAGIVGKVLDPTVYDMIRNAQIATQLEFHEGLYKLKKELAKIPEEPDPPMSELMRPFEETGYLFFNHCLFECNPNKDLE